MSIYQKIKLRQIDLSGGTPGLDLYLMRGLPGSGKSTKIKQIFAKHGIPYTMNNRRLHIVSNDDYSTYYRNKQTNQIKKYVDMNEQQLANPRFELLMQQKYHMKFDKSLPMMVQLLMKEKMSHGVTPLIIDNTFLNDAELVPAFALGTQFGYSIHIVEYDIRPVLGGRTSQTPQQAWSQQYKQYRKSLDQRAERTRTAQQGSGKNISEDLLWGRFSMAPNFIRTLQRSDSMGVSPQTKLQREPAQAYRKRILKQAPRQLSTLEPTIAQFVKTYRQTHP